MGDAEEKVEAAAPAPESNGGEEPGPQETANGDPPAAANGDQPAAVEPPQPQAPPKEEAPAPSPPKPKKVVKSPLDLSNYILKTDQFEGVHVLDDDEKDRIVGAPNFRKVPGLPVWGSAQPSELGIGKIVELVAKKKSSYVDPKAEEGAEGKSSGPMRPAEVLWFNMRQEPIVYIDSKPHAPRAPNA